MVEKEKIKKLFESSTFRKHSIHFYKEQKSVSEVKGESGVSRSTIYDHFNVFKEGKFYDGDYILPKGGGKEIPYLLTQKVLIDWLDELLNLNRGETDLLSRILKDETVNDFLRKPPSWDAVIFFLGSMFSIAIIFLERKGELAKENLLKKGSETSLKLFYEEKRRQELLELNRKYMHATQVVGEYIKKDLETAENFFRKIMNADFPFGYGNPVSIAHQANCGAIHLARVLEESGAIDDTQ